MKWVSMAELPKITMSNAKHHSGLMNHASPSGRRRTNLVLADARRMLPARMHSANCKVRWRRNNGLGLFFMVQTRFLSFSEGKS